MAMADFDGDGKDEIITISRFHGDTLSVWHEDATPDRYVKVWEDPQRRDFLHAIWAGRLAGSVCAVMGNRKDGRDLLRVWFENGGYHVEVIDHKIMKKLSRPKRAKDFYPGPKIHLTPFRLISERL